MFMKTNLILCLSPVLVAAMKLNWVLCLATAVYAAPLPILQTVTRRLNRDLVRPVMESINREIRELDESLKLLSQPGQLNALQTKYGKTGASLQEMTEFLSSKLALKKQARYWEPRFARGAQFTSKKPVPIRFEEMKTAGAIMSLEGPQKYKAGQILMTGVDGEQYVISSMEKFQKLYDIAGDSGMAVPKFNIRQVLEASRGGSMETSWSTLHYKKGDLLTRVGAGDYNSIKPDIFQKTFTVAKTAEELEYFEITQSII